MKILVLIDDKPVPLTDCDWVMWAPCGCLAAVTVAQTDFRTLASEEDAWLHLEEGKRRVEKSKREGFRLELVTHERYSKELFHRLGCREHTPRWGVSA